MREGGMGLNRKESGEEVGRGGETGKQGGGEEERQGRGFF